MDLSPFSLLEKRRGIPDTLFHVSLSQRSGESLTNEFIGNVFSTQQVFGGETFRLVDFDLQRYFFDRAVDVRLGRIAAADDFLVSPYYWYFMSGGINANPDSIFINAPGMSGYPNATWGMRIRAATTPRTYAMAGVYNGDPDIRANENHGFDFSLHGPLFAIAEVGYQRNGRPDDEGKLGNYKSRRLLQRRYTYPRTDSRPPKGYAGLRRNLRQVQLRLAGRAATCPSRRPDRRCAGV